MSKPVKYCIVIGCNRKHSAKGYCKMHRYHYDMIYRQKQNTRKRRWERNHPDKHEATQKGFRERNPDYYKEYYERNKERMNNYANQYHEELFWSLKRELIMTIQGRIGCDLCPVTDIKILEFHHTRVNGDKDRKRFTRKCHKNHDYDKLKWLKHMIKHYYEENNKYPLQVLCSNCHTRITQEFGHNNKKEEQDQNLITLTNFIV